MKTACLGILLLAATGLPLIAGAPSDQTMPANHSREGLPLPPPRNASDRRYVDPPGQLARPDQNRPGLAARHERVAPPLVFTDRHGVALGGFDPVAYFTQGAPLPGKPGIQGTHEGAIYRFVSEDNRAAFAKDPARYAPAYGGFCGYAASIGKVRPADPHLWSIVDGRLVVQHTVGAAQLWARDVPANKAKADRLWPRLVEAKAGSRHPIDRLFGKSVLPSLD